MMVFLSAVWYKEWTRYEEARTADERVGCVCSAV